MCGRQESWEERRKKKESMKQVDVWVSVVLCLPLIGMLEKEWCFSIYQSTGCASPRPNETIIEDDRKQSGNVAFMDTLTGPVYHSLCVYVLVCVCSHNM